MIQASTSKYNSTDLVTFLLFAGDSTGQFSGVLDCFSKTFRREGLLAFYNGFGPNFARLGSWNVTMFLTVEQVKKLFVPKD